MQFNWFEGVSFWTTKTVLDVLYFAFGNTFEYFINQISKGKKSKKYPYQKLVDHAACVTKTWEIFQKKTHTHIYILKKTNLIN